MSVQKRQLLTRLILAVGTCVSLTTWAGTSAIASPRYPILTPAGVPPVNSVADSLFGFITSNMTLTKASPGPVWHVIGDVFVQPGVTLTIEPGVTVLFEANSDLLNSGDFFSKSELIVRGALSAQGSSSDSIRFTSTSSTPGSWGQVKLQPASVAAMAFCRLSEATVGVSSGTTGLDAHDCVVAHSTTGASTFGSVANLAGLSVVQSPTGIVAAATLSTIDQCLVTNHGLTGTLLTTSGVLSYLVIRNCGFSNSGTSSPGISATADSVQLQDTNVTLWGTGAGNAVAANCQVFRASRCQIRGRTNIGISVRESPQYELRTSAIDHVLITGASTGYSVVTTILSSGVVSMNYTTIDSCYYGVNAASLQNQFPKPQLALRNSIISNSYGQAVVGTSFMAGSADFCNFWNVSLTSGLTLGSNIVSLNPLYVNSTVGDYHLRAISPSRVLGENGTELGFYGPNSGASGVGGSGPEPSPLSLLPISPNPLSGSGTIAFNLSKASTIALDVFDCQGRVVALERAPFEAGLQSIRWEPRSDSGRPLPNGVYFYRVTGAGTSQVGRVTVVR